MEASGESRTEYVILEHVGVQPGVQGDVETHGGPEAWREVKRVTVAGTKRAKRHQLIQANMQRPGTFKAVSAREWDADSLTLVKQEMLVPADAA